MEKSKSNPGLIKTNQRRLQSLSLIRIGEILTDCEVVKISKFGIFVKFGDQDDALVHVSDFEWDEVSEKKAWPELGSKVDAVVLEVEDWAGNVLLGIKQMKLARWTEARSRFPIGTTVTGTITRILNGTVQLELEKGIKGEIPTSDFKGADWDNISGTLKVGMPLSAMVTYSKLQAMQFGLSHVATLPPRRLKVETEKGLPVKLRLPTEECVDFEAEWATAGERYPVGSVVEAKIVKIVPYGAFVNLGPLLQGFIHASEISRGKVSRVADHLSVGQIVNAKIVSVDPMAKRIALSIRVLYPDPWDEVASKFPAGTTARGLITSIKQYGLFGKRPVSDLG